MVRGSLILTYETTETIDKIQSVRKFTLETKSDISEVELEVLLRRMKKADEPRLQAERVKHLKVKPQVTELSQRRKFIRQKLKGGIIRK